MNKNDKNIWFWPLTDDVTYYLRAERDVFVINSF